MVIVYLSLGKSACAQDSKRHIEIKIIIFICICMWILWVGNRILVSDSSVVIGPERKTKGSCKTQQTHPRVSLVPSQQASGSSALLAWWWLRASLRTLPGLYSSALIAHLDLSLLFAGYSKKTLLKWPLQEGAGPAGGTGKKKKQEQVPLPSS